MYTYGKYLYQVGHTGTAQTGISAIAIFSIAGITPVVLSEGSSGVPPSPQHTC